jgi:RecA-family ATPase
MLSLNEIARAVGGEVSGGRVLAPAPGHSARDRGMSIRISDDAPDGFVVHCFNGCDDLTAKDHVRERLGLPSWQPKGKAGSGSADHLASRPINMAAKRTRHVADYDYHDASGNLIYQVRRFAVDDGSKNFLQRRPDGKGGWIYKLDDIARVAYRLADLAKYPDATVFVCEGEKDADHVAALDLTATTAASGKWTVDVAAALRDRDVIVCEDNDAAGRQHSLAAATALHGIAMSIRIVSFTDLPKGGDVSDWLAQGHDAKALIARGLAAPLWQPEAELPPVAGAPILEPLSFVDTSTWRVNEGVPPREWGVRDLFPRRNVALLSGEGAVGKTILLLQLGVAHALGRDWIGTLPEPGPFLYFGAEDETDEIHRRLADILKSYGVDFPDLNGKVHLLTFAGEDAVLGHADHSGIVKPTPLYARLLKGASEIKPVLIGIDTSADVFAGNENDRAQVRQFVGLLRKLAIEANAYVIVNAHPSLTGINSGTGLSGSTGWHNSVRARAYMTSVKTDRDDEPDPNLRTLEFKKNNYGPVGRSIALRWDSGVYKLVPGAGALDKMVTEQTADRLFVALLDRFNDQGRNVSEKAASKNYAPTAFSKEADAKKYGIKKLDFEEAMRRLFAASAITVQTYGAPCRGTTRLVVR